MFATDDFFADKARLIDPAPPAFIPGKYDDHGKWMDGWESRRKRVPGHDWCVVKLGKPGLLKGLTIDTSFFTGNYPPACSLEWANSAAHIPGDDDWKPLLPDTALKGDSQLTLPVTLSEIVTHLRLHIYPDGGVARLRVWGQVMADFAAGMRTDLAAMENGGLPVACNDQHYGQVANMLAPGRARDMGDGWETRRRREPGHDWAIIALARPGRIEEILVDTNHFKGNYPDRCFVQGTGETGLAQEALIVQSANWPIILPEQKLSADSEHRFTREIAAHDPVKFIRLNIIPDGGVARLRLWGKPV